MKRSGRLLVILFFTGMILCPDRCRPDTRILKTAYKTYTVGTWKGMNFLCEPYQVQKNDWIYKIFKKKGNLSKMDLPLFMTIFKHLNPHISNPNDISPGQQISIPLKKLAPNDMASRSKRNFVVPILQMSELSKKININKFPLPPQVKTPHPTQSPPEPILPAMQSHLNTPTRNMKKIEQYAAMIQGKLINKGTYYLPGPRQKDIPLNLNTTPIIQLKNNSKIVLLPHDFPQADFLKSLKGIWPNITFMDMDAVGKKVADPPIVSTIPKDRPSALAMFAQKSKFDLIPYETTLPLADGINITVKAHRIPRDHQPDLLIVLGSIYGKALTLLKNQGFRILSILPGDRMEAMGKKLFDALGVSTVVNPVFMNRTSRRSIPIPGLFVGDGKNLFITSQKLNLAIQHFLAKNRIIMLQVHEN
ncbi:LysM domain-containing protein [Desulfocicer vacuolatum DSM 3385]|uniref:LysM domain-containing protein n=1 Tax=Desulfocicer vacuolatum DSM 3385 TaxID=1121400 RepID=A0A1W1ZTY7_9BACT|nr:LysM peptidoglycan-binding domain-containing protein [Desulfocicer vacuolatum]SMC51919.1 LysM domain-containing protein [Desulfocicer vacuolatum DSM 3385]